jgi:hypothetical protein
MIARESVRREDEGWAIRGVEEPVVVECCISGRPPPILMKEHRFVPFPVLPFPGGRWTHESVSPV